MKTVKGIIVDPIKSETFSGEVVVEHGRIKQIKKADDVPQRYILPGMVDAHIHIESSMLIPSEFARLAVQHGTVATVSDPHEIANVCGKEGVEYMIENGKKVPLKFYFGAPSCVPATPFETAGAVLDVDDVKELLERDEIHYLAEMMNWPGVLNDDPDVLAKIEAALKLGKPVDGHAPGLNGERARKYASAGITTDHESFTRQEAIDKLEAGMLIAIREGSAAKNYEALIDLLKDYPGKMMFCSDDKHPDDLLRGHINEIVSRTLARGFDLYDVLHASSVLPVQHYKLKVGLLQPGDPADFIIVDNPESMNVLETWIDGEQVYDNDTVRFGDIASSRINNFKSYEVSAEDFKLYSENQDQQIIVANDGELITGSKTVTLQIKDGEVLAAPEKDILKIAVVNRYEKQPPAVGFITNFGLKNGAIASSVGHDSHNIIVVGTSDEFLSRAVNLIMENEGGISAVHGENEDVLPLPIGGIMSDDSGEIVARGYERLSKISREMGSTLKAPFMLISFMALLVIPSLKMSDKGLFDGENFKFVDQ
ncbi:MAG: adenine deaminase [Balneolaceae bacterium]|nr:MAG: adenine deaminase [Balneolaceae bacterium]